MREAWIGKQSNQEMALTLTKHAEEYQAAPKWSNRPQRPVAPFPYDAQEVIFENETDGFTLSGTLTIPQTDTPR